MTFVDLILPIPLKKLYTYSVEKEMVEDLEIGKRTIVEFGRKKLYTAIIYKIHEKKPKDYETKNIISIIDDFPSISILQIKFWEWIANYYFSSIGEVYKAAVPSALKIESETKIFLRDEIIDFENLNINEKIIIENLKKHKQLSIKDLQKKTEQKNIIFKVNNLLKKNVIATKEKLTINYKPKIIKIVKLTPFAQDKENLKNIFKELEKKPKHLHLLMNYLNVSKFLNQRKTLNVEKKKLLEISKISLNIFNVLVKKNIFEIQNLKIGRLENSNNILKKPSELNDFQKKALEEIKNSFEEKDVSLLHGVTSSGKTEIYIHLINEEIKKGKQVLYLLPEIALTTQIITRLKNIFGNKVGVYHSKFANSERVEIWRNILEQKNGESSDDLKIILGVRSSIFLPFHNLGLIIIDEEHENTYKQNNPAPRYNARDTSIVLAKLHNAKVLMGTATPSLETFFNAKNKKYSIINLKERFKNIELPEVIIANTHIAYKKKQMIGHHFTQTLLENMKIALDEKKQIILFQNRRGFSPYIECMTCKWIPKCENCDVNLTYYQKENKLSCHYCGYTEKPPKTCKACESTNLKNRGFGTEKIEEEIPLFFPKAKIGRMDLNNTRTRKSYENIISRFENGKIDILIGTQMISKGLDFDNVSIVGIMNADNLLNFSDFRALERSYQLMAQVSGRAGRKNKRGKVIIQTTEPNHRIIKNVIENNYINMYENELEQRKMFKYPPFYKLIKITVKHRHLGILERGANDLAKNLREIFGNRILGPEFPSIKRIQKFYLKNILLKIEKDKSPNKTRFFLQKAIDNISNYNYSKSLKILINVDPY